MAKEEEVLEQELQAAEEVKQVQEEQSAAVEVLTVEDVTKRLEAIQEIVKEKHPVIAGEDAHIEQDKLLKEVLEAIAKGSENPAELAAEALEVFSIEFTRWYS